MPQDKLKSAKNIRSKITAFDVESISESNIKTIQVLSNVSKVIGERTREESEKFDRLYKLLEFLPRNQIDQNRQQQRIFLSIAKLTAALELKNEKNPDKDIAEEIKKLKIEGNKIGIPGSNEPKNLMESLLQKHFNLSPQLVRTEGIHAAYKDQFTKDLNFITGRQSKETRTPFESQVEFEKKYELERKHLAGFSAIQGVPQQNPDGTITIFDTNKHIIPESNKTPKQKNYSTTSESIQPLTTKIEPRVGEDRKALVESKSQVSSHLETLVKGIASDVRLIRYVIHDRVRYNASGKGSKFIASESHGKVKAGDFVRDPDKGKSIEGSLFSAHKKTGKRLFGIEESSTSSADLAPDKRPEGKFATSESNPSSSPLGGIMGGIAGGLGKIGKIIGGIFSAALPFLPLLVAVGGGVALGYGIDKGIDSTKSYLRDRALKKAQEKTAKSHGFKTYDDMEKYITPIRNRQKDAAIAVEKSKMSEVLNKKTEEQSALKTDSVPPPVAQTITPVQNITNNNIPPAPSVISVRTIDSSFVRFQNRRTSRIL